MVLVNMKAALDANTNPALCNYDPNATIADNASCEFGTCDGCTDPPRL